MTRDLYGFILAPSLPDVVSDRGPLGRFLCVQAGNIVALAGSPFLRLPGRSRIRHQLGRLRAYQRALEGIMRRAPVVPAQFGSRFPGRSRLVHLVEQNEEKLAGAIGSYGHLLQFEIQVSGPFAPETDPRVETARRYILEELKDLGLTVREEKAREGGTVLDSTILLRPLDEPRLDAALARLDGEFGGWLHFSCIGPLPPCDFVRVVVTRQEKPQDRSQEWTLSLESMLHTHL